MSNAEEVYKAIQYNQEEDKRKIEHEKTTSKSYYITLIKNYLNEMIKDKVFYKVFEPRNLKFPSVFDEALHEVLVNKEPYYYQWKLKYVEDNVGYQLSIELKMKSYNT